MGKIRIRGQAVGELAALTDCLRYLSKGCLDIGAATGIGGDFQCPQNGNTASQEDGVGSAESRYCNLWNEGTNHREFKQELILKIRPLLGRRAEFLKDFPEDDQPS